MENATAALTNFFDAYQQVVGVFLPLLIAVVAKSRYSHLAKAMVTFALVILASVGHLWYSGEWGAWSESGLKILLLCATTYYAFWKPTGIADFVEKKVNP